MEPELVACIAILNRDIAEKLLKLMKKQTGRRGGTIIRGEGTVTSRLANTLGIHSAERELLIALVKASDEGKVYELFNDKLGIAKKGTGILFSLPVTSCYGKSSFDYPFKWTADAAKYQLLWTIVERKKGDDVVNLGRQAGATGATILHGRGLADDQPAKIFNIPLETEKEIVLQLLPAKRTASVAETIETALHLDQPGYGIQFTVPVADSLGIAGIQPELFDNGEP